MNFKAASAAILIASTLLLHACTLPVLSVLPAWVVKDNDFRGDFLVDHHRHKFDSGTARIFLPRDNLPRDKWTLIGKDDVGIKGMWLKQTLVSLHFRRGALAKFRTNEFSHKEVAGLVYFLDMSVTGSPAEDREKTRQPAFADTCSGNYRSQGDYFLAPLSKRLGVTGCWFISSVDFTEDGVSFAGLDQAINEPLEDELGIQRSSKMQRQMEKYVTDRNIRVPATMIVIGFLGDTDTRSLMALYFFNPALDGVARGRGGVSDWHVHNIRRSPKRRAYLKKLRTWGTKWQHRFVRGLLIPTADNNR